MLVRGFFFVGISDVLDILIRESCHCNRFKVDAKKSVRDLHKPVNASIVLRLSECYCRLYMS
jgi:ferredoxin-thioredoxin reductase catalytic subunit